MGESKYRTVTVYKESPISDGNLGQFINEAFALGIEAVLVVNGPSPHAGHQHGDMPLPDTGTPYTNIQGNVGSS